MHLVYFQELRLSFEFEKKENKKNETAQYGDEKKMTLLFRPICIDINFRNVDQKFSFL